MFHPQIALYKDIDFSLTDFADGIGANKLTETTKMELLMRRWRNPSLSIHGIQGAFAEPGEKTVIPGKDNLFSLKGNVIKRVA